AAPRSASFAARAPAHASRRRRSPPPPGTRPASGPTTTRSARTPGRREAECGATPEKLLGDRPEHEQRPPVRALRELRLVRVLHRQAVDGRLLDGAQLLVAEHLVPGKCRVERLRQLVLEVPPPEIDRVVRIPCGRQQAH